MQEYIDFNKYLLGALIDKNIHGVPNGLPEPTDFTLDQQLRGLFEDRRITPPSEAPSYIKPPTQMHELIKQLYKNKKI